jgi:4-hydroxy-2-oxoheptanedioate aldolase
MHPARVLREAITSERLTIGTQITEHLWPQAIEICQKAGMDYVIIDWEHGPHDSTVIGQACQIGRYLNFPVIIRSISCEYDVLRRVLDLGPCGIMLPGVEDVAQLEMVRDAVYMPPRGRRRPGGLGNYWMKDFNYNTWKTEFEDDLIVLPQIETLKGVENAAAIAAHDIVTAVAVGPYDLAADMGCCWEPNNPGLQENLAKIREAGRAAGKNMWMVGNGPALIQQGYTFLCTGEFNSFLSQGIGQTIQQCNKVRAS